jgi:hypothetical protein
MDRPPRPRTAGVIDRVLLVRAWALLGGVSAVLVMGGFFYTLWRAGWHLGDPTGAGTPLHHAYLQATTMTFAGIVTCQIGTAFAARTDRASLFTIGLRTNPLLLWGIAFELLFTAAVIYPAAATHLRHRRAAPCAAGSPRAVPVPRLGCRRVRPLGTPPPFADRQRLTVRKPNGSTSWSRARQCLTRHAGLTGHPDGST